MLTSIEGFLEVGSGVGGHQGRQAKDDEQFHGWSAGRKNTDMTIWSEGIFEFLELPRGFRQLLSRQNVPAETHFRQPRVEGDLNESGAESVGS